MAEAWSRSVRRGGQRATSAPYGGTVTVTQQLGRSDRGNHRTCGAVELLDGLVTLIMARGMWHARVTRDEQKTQEVSYFCWDSSNTLLVRFVNN